MHIFINCQSFTLIANYRREAEKLEIERRRELTEEERVKEDMAYLAKKTKEEQAQKAAGSVEKYHHKGAFFMVSYP
jgi:microfibrillar-associated protein 1